MTSTDEQIKSTAERFAGLFSGLTRGYGHYDVVPGTQPDTNGKVPGKAVTITGPVTDALYAAHLAGERSLGIIPVNDEALCSFGAIDDDHYDLDPMAEYIRFQAILQKIQDLGLTQLVPCRTKSGGLHHYIFCAAPVTAQHMRELLGEIRDALGLPEKTEIFPKQSRLEDGKFGGWISLPYFQEKLNAYEVPISPEDFQTKRYALNGLGLPMPLDDFLDYAEINKQPASWFDEPLKVKMLVQVPKKKAEPTDDEIKRFVMPDEVGDGEWSNCFFPYACQLRQKNLDLEAMKADLYTTAERVNKSSTPVDKKWLDDLAKRVWKRYEVKETPPKKKKGSAPSIPALARFLTGKCTPEETVLFGPGKGLSFARAPGDSLYVFTGGVYVADGERVVRREIKELAKDAWESHELADRLIEYILVDAPELWERPPLDTINVQNGLLNVASRTIRKHSPDFLSPIQLPIFFDDEAKCPAITKFCSEVLPEDTQSILWHMAAWLMLPDTNIQKAVLLLGVGSNGKSVLLNILADFIGQANCSSSTLHSLEGGRFATCALLGKLANLCADLPTRALSDTDIFKRITGGDPIDGEKKFGSTFSFRPYSRLLFSANTAPRSDDATHGFFRRWLVIPFNRRTFSETDSDTVPIAIMREKLGSPAELRGLLNRALDSITQIRKGFIPESKSMRTAWAEFKATTDPLTIWIESNLTLAPDGHLTKKEVLDAYNTHRRDEGKPGTDTGTLTQCLQQWQAGIHTGQRTVGGVIKTWCYIGVRWMTQGERDGQKRMDTVLPSGSRIYFIGTPADPGVKAAIRRLIQE